MKWYQWWCLIKVPGKRLQHLFLIACCLALGTSGRPATAKEHVLRGPMSMSPAYTKLDTEITRGASVLKSGSIFPITLLTPLSTTNVRIGDSVSAMLVEDIMLGKQCIAPKGSKLKGWVSKVQHPKNVLQSKVSASNWANANAAIGLHFSSIEPSNESPRLRIDAEPAPHTPVRGPKEQHELCIHKDGCISVKWSGIKYSATGVAISAVSWATGPFKFITGPVLSGTAGAIKPEYALDKPIEKGDALTRTKGGLIGAVKGLPGGFIVTGAGLHGGDVAVPSGVQIELRLVSDLVIANEIASSSQRVVR